MSRELIVLTPEKPDLDALPALVAATSPTLQAISGYIFDADNRLLVRVQEPVHITVPGEVERLLETTSPSPIWWTEIHTAADSPEAEKVARHCAESFNGTIWTPR